MQAAQFCYRMLINILECIPMLTDTVARCRTDRHALGTIMVALVPSWTLVGMHPLCVVSHTKDYLFTVFYPPARRKLIF